MQGKALARAQSAKREANGGSGVAAESAAAAQCEPGRRPIGRGGRLGLRLSGLCSPQLRKAELALINWMQDGIYFQLLT
jgi:hypothetical protein